jgi:hypothetical protein
LQSSREIIINPPACVELGSRGSEACHVVSYGDE